jgi:hypothetical protein
LSRKTVLLLRQDNRLSLEVTYKPYTPILRQEFHSASPFSTAPEVVGGRTGDPKNELAAGTAFLVQGRPINKAWVFHVPTV